MLSMEQTADAGGFRQTIGCCGALRVNCNRVENDTYEDANCGDWIPL